MNPPPRLLLRYDTPEMDRLPLERVVLRVKALGVAMVQATLLEALTPPPRAHVDDAVEKLLALGALKRVWPTAAPAGDAQPGPGARPPPPKGGPTAEHDGVAVTSLGRAVLSLPVESNLARMLALALPLGCIADAVVIAALATAGHSSDLFVPLQAHTVGEGSQNGGRGGGGGPGYDMIYAGGAGTGAVVAPANEPPAITVRAIRARARFDRKLYSEPLAMLEAFRQYLAFRQRFQRGRREGTKAKDSSGGGDEEAEWVAAAPKKKGRKKGGAGGGNPDAAAAAAAAASAAAAAAGPTARELTMEEAEAQWCIERGLLRRRLVELCRKVDELGYRVADVFPGAKPSLAPLLAAVGNGVGMEDRETMVGAGGEAAEDLAAVAVNSLGADVPMLRMLLCVASATAAPFALLKGVRRMRPPRALSQ